MDFILTVLLIAFIATLSLSIGLVIGVRSERKCFPKTIGRIVIDHSDENQNIFMEIDSGCYQYFHPGSKVSLEIVEKNYLDSQK